MPPEQSKLLRALLTKDKQKKDRKVVHPQAKEVIINVVNFMKQESCGEFVIPARKVQCRAAAATGFSARTIRRVVKESKSLPISEHSGEGSSISFPPKKPTKRPKPKTGLNNLTRCEVRKIIHRIYVSEKTVPTIKKIHQKLVEEIGFKGGSRSAHKIVKELGFFWKKTKSKSFVLIEKHDIRLKRIEFLRDIIKFRREGRTILYLGETTLLTSLSIHEKPKIDNERLVIVHAGGDRGFVPNALMILQTKDCSEDYQRELSNHYHHWVTSYLLPSLPPHSVVVLDSSAFLNVQAEKIPSSDSNAEEIKMWLRSKNISFREDMLRPELHQITKRHAPKFKKQKGRLEQILTEQSHTVLRLPQDHPDLNPLEFLWEDMKHYAATHNTTFKIEDVKLLCQQRLAELGPEALIIRCNHVRSIEQIYLESEGIVDHEVEKVMAKTQVIKDNNISKIEENHTEEPEEHTTDNINFVRHFMGGLLGLEDYKMFSN